MLVSLQTAKVNAFFPNCQNFGLTESKKVYFFDDAQTKSNKNESRPLKSLYSIPD
jgi:hypothetical protein